MSRFPGRPYIRLAGVRSGVLRFFAEKLGAPSGAEIESLRWRGEGLFYTVFGFGLIRAGRLNGLYALRILNPVRPDGEALDRMVRSSRLLGILERGLGPASVGCDPTGEYLGHPFTIESFVAGMSLAEMRKNPERHLPLAARELSRVHRTPVTQDMRRILGTSGSFAKGELERAKREVRELRRPPEVLLRALESAERLQPADREISLLHGDPLLQNLILHMDFEKPGESFTWIDWEFARLGDPAYDLSIFTRGRLGSLCGLKGGRPLYLEAYRKQSGAAIEEERLLFYELLLLVRQACGRLREGQSALPEADRRMLEGLLGLLPRT